MRAMTWAAAMLLAVGSTAANAVDRLYVFGDSLVDSGNAQAISPSRVPTNLYPSGRFVNGASGRNFADYLGQRLGLGDATASLSPGTPFPGFSGGTNFAVGGSTVAFSTTTPSLATQIGGVPGSPATYPYYYTAAVAAGVVAPIDANSLVLIATGGNDIRNFSPNFAAADFGISAFVTGVKTTLNASLEDLYARGARNFVLVGVPNIGLIPEVNGNPTAAAIASQVSAQLNLAYQSLDTDYSARLGGTGDFTLFDLAGLQGRLTTNPTAYGFDLDKVGKSCVRDGGATALATNCAGYAYYDTIHPTDAANRIIAGEIFASISAVPEPDSWAMLIVGFGVVGGALRGTRRRVVAATA